MFKGKTNHLLPVMALLLSLPLSASADDLALKRRADRIFNRIAGVPPSATQKGQLNSKIQSGVLDVRGVVDIAMNDRNFYEITMLRLATPWSNIEASSSASLHLNDLSALAIGLVRDNLPFNRILFGDEYYVGAGSGVSASNVDWVVAGSYGSIKIPPYTRGDLHPVHYSQLHRMGYDLSDPSVLKRVSQVQQGAIPGYVFKNTDCTGSFTNPDDPAYDCADQGEVLGRVPYISTVGQSSPDAAGALTTRAFALAAYRNGTNRRAVAMIVRNHLCNDMLALKDVSLPDNRVRRDVTRNPGGDYQNYLFNCKGCHGFMDALAGAFALFNFEAERMVFRPGFTPYTNNPADIAQSVSYKNNQNNSVFPAGHTVIDNSWVNHLPLNRSKDLGWRDPIDGGGYQSGTGVNSLGRAIAASRKFSECKVEQVFESVCLRAPGSDDRLGIERVADQFESTTHNYNLKEVFRGVAELCL